MTCRTMFECGNCGRSFFEQWRVQRHVCKEQLSVLDRIREWRKFRNTSEIEKFFSAISMADGELYLRVTKAYDLWKNSHPPGKNLAVQEVLDPIDDDEIEVDVDAD